ncbi:hypothetical protein VNO78_10372 [Psophocarpus tetragonolobus]|uniref:Uncharacterized protein n=1 Tax=Psophocarpus tetragonolobus TaxID=3891 RepID=A0AAN9SJQ4_PSOTE
MVSDSDSHLRKRRKGNKLKESEGQSANLYQRVLVGAETIAKSSERVLSLGGFCDSGLTSESLATAVFLLCLQGSEMGCQWPKIGASYLSGLYVVLLLFPTRRTVYTKPRRT